MREPLYTPPADSSRGAIDEATLLADLNPAQREAVTAPAGPLLVLAGAGTGKTRVLTRRVGWKILKGASPRAVLAITFTNKAADVLKERLAALPGGSGVTAGTFHSFCAVLLRRHADRIGGSRDFSILDSEDQGRLLRGVLEELRIDTKRFRPQEFAAAISHAKNGAAGRAPAGSRDEGFRAYLPEVSAAYAQRLASSHAYDFDDLLVESVRLLREVEDVALACRDRWRHVLVDEYQDTNAVQAELLRALVGPDPDLTVVGDPDQSIYRWRGASVRNILRFPDDYPGARVVALEQNYRSTARILRAAEAVAAKNSERYEKRLRTANPLGGPVLDLCFRDQTREAAGVSRLLAAWREAGIPWSEMAVFVRVNHASRSVETSLRNSGIPYAMVSGVEFFQRREVKDCLAYARLLENPYDETAFARVLEAPRRGFGEGSLTKLRAFAAERGVSLPEAAASSIPGISGKARKGLDQLLAVLARLRLVPRSSIGDLLEAIATESGYRAHLLAQVDDMARARVENVDELVAAGREAERVEPGVTLRDFLERVALASEQDGLDEASGRVAVMSAHAAKGLEFDAVVVLGAEAGWFPHTRNRGDKEDVEEERRLFYVALTRARSRLALTHATQREGWQGLERRDPSPFLLEVPDDVVEVLDTTGLYSRDRARRQRSETLEPWDVEPQSERAPGRDLDEDPPAGEAVFDRDSSRDLVPGDRVVHPYFGEGKLVAKSGAGASLRVTIDFDSAGTKTILWSHALLERAGELPPGANT